MRWFLLGLLLLVLSAQAEVLQGTVAGISGGDAITIADGDGKQHRVMLLGIEAPDLGHPDGARSYQRLSDLLYNVPVSVDVRGRDSFGRLLGKVLVNQRDVALRQIETGLAMHVPSELQDGDERSAYARMQDQAKAAKLGLWRDQSLVEAQGPSGDEELYCKEIRNTLQCDDGTVFTQTGTRVYGSDGSVYRKRGDTVFGSDGATYRQQGRVTYGSDGSICRRRGRLVTCY